MFRRGRIQFFKIAIGAIIVLAVFYFLFNNPNAHKRAKQALAISARFSADKPKERPVLVKGINSLNKKSLILLSLVKKKLIFTQIGFQQSLEIMSQKT